jgi:hypothetical protein
MMLNCFGGHLGNRSTRSDVERAAEGSRDGRQKPAMSLTNESGSSTSQYSNVCPNQTTIPDLPRLLVIGRRKKHLF